MKKMHHPQLFLPHITWDIIKCHICAVSLKMNIFGHINEELVGVF